MYVVVDVSLTVWWFEDYVFLLRITEYKQDLKVRVSERTQVTVLSAPAPAEKVGCIYSFGAEAKTERNMCGWCAVYL